ncbi:nucleoside hydrolase [Salibacterium aidingense]|uniref:nucleoside hydrolase n=1 Tax=Salibacterium aidingense TaxID=384933 RepID=UPI003BC10FFC
MGRKKIWLDVDTGIDDALGLMLACSHETFQVEGVSTVSGNVSLPKATANTLQVLSLLHKKETPVYSGAPHPFMRSPVYEHAVHGEDGLGGLSDPAFSHVPSLHPFGPDQLIEAIRKHKQEMTLIFTGPLTNLAIAVRKAPDIVDDVGNVIFMGGVIRGGGNITPAAEFNMYADPEAAHIVLHSGFFHLTQVGLDVTRQALLTENHLAAIFKENQAVGKFVSDVTSHYRKRYEQRNGINACALHDPLAVAYAMKPEILKTKPCYVDIEYSSRISDGSLVADENNRLGQTPNLFISSEVNLPLFYEWFHQSLVSLKINEGVSR